MCDILVAPTNTNFIVVPPTTKILASYWLKYKDVAIFYRLSLVDSDHVIGHVEVDIATKVMFDINYQPPRCMTFEVAERNERTQNMRTW